METDKVYFWDPYLKGVGQIMLQNNALTGLLFLIGILINAPLMGVAAILAVIVGTLTAKILKFKEENINSGLYGFNATLVGVALIAFFEPTVTIWIAIVVLSAVSTLIMNFCLEKKVPVFTFPFIVLVWISLYVFHSVAPVPDASPDYLVDLVDNYTPFSLMNYGLGFGDVIFQGSLISGIIFFIAVYVSSPTSALYGLFGALFGVLIAILLKDRIEDVKLGMFSFNPVLCAIAFAGTRKIDGLYVIIAVILSGITEEIMIRCDLPVLTFPFVMGTWLTLIIRDVLVKRFIPSSNIE
ncbi:urea transporter [Dysgonomonas alginatilytica]|uniref:Urea transporter n=1 Tax=Dysgonomonas alginatilytica TaxID=1605892 RepID=A0A2V3PQQ3_9BACT|nr:urea transporter [Dysgonomonas alginatilytica]PXV66311.1 urea transporter [Dysgonomonas alginatilytica]